MQTRLAEYWIRKLGLLPHPEGGWYRETYRAVETVQNQKGETRRASTAIYFLLEGAQISALHRIAADEVWHFYEGGTLIVARISPAGKVSEIRLGRNLENREVLQTVVPAGTWFGAYLAEPGSFALVGCTVAPGFDFKDLEFADPAALLRQHPAAGPLLKPFARRSS